MRCVVVLFGRGPRILPRNNPIYNDSYGLQGLSEQLDRLAGGAVQTASSFLGSVAQGHLSVSIDLQRVGTKLYRFNGMVEGFSLPAISTRMIRYRKPWLLSKTNWTAQRCGCASDSGTVCRSKVKVRQGRGSTWVTRPWTFPISRRNTLASYMKAARLRTAKCRSRRANRVCEHGDQPALPFHDWRRWRTARYLPCSPS
jgi:hypothetical protein